MSRPDLTDEQLAARIREACAVQAEALAVDDRPFERGSPAPAGRSASSSPLPRRRILALAAAIALVGAVAAAVVVRSDDGHDTVRTGSTTTVPAAPGPWLAPSEAPMGLEVRSVVWKEHRPIEGFDIRAQLFARGEGGGHVMVTSQPGDGNLVGDPGPQILGQPSGVQTIAGADVRLNWVDSGVSFEARWRGMTQEEAIALVQGLGWRSTDRSAGLEAPVKGSTRLVDEAEPDQLSYDVDVSYGTGAERIAVHTSASDRSTYDMVETMFSSLGEIGPDGSTTSYGEEAEVFQVVSPGRLVRTDAARIGASRAQLEGVAASVGPISETRLRALERATPGADLASDPPATTSPATPTTTRSRSGLQSDATEGLDLQLGRLDGNGTTTLGELADGRPMVVLLWSTWCVPCIQSLQEVDAIAAARPGAVVVAVAVEGQRGDVQRIVDGTGVDLPVLLDPDRSAEDALGASSLPWIVLVEADGRPSGSGPAGGTEGPAIASTFLDGAG